MTRSRVAAIAGLALAGACVDGSRMAAPPVAPPLLALVGGTETRITTDPADQLDPALAGNWIVYTDYRGADADVWYYDIARGQELPVTTALGNQVLADVSPTGLIVYDDYDLGDVFLYDVASGTTTNLTNNLGHGWVQNPAISGDLVVWQDSRDVPDYSYEIYGKDLRTGLEFRASQDPMSDQSPDVSGSTVVWERCSVSSCDIVLYDVSTGIETAVTDTPDRDERNPHTDGARIVYDGGPVGSPSESDIYLYDIATGTERALVLPGRQINPHISRDLVSFETLESGLYHLMLWDLSTGGTYPIAVNPSASQYLNDIDGTRVVYTDDRNGQLDIYLYSFSVVPDGSVQTIRDAVTGFEQSGAITNHGIAKSLLAFLSQVEAAVAAGDTATARARLEHFIKFVQSQTPKHISASAAAELITMAEALLASLGA